jgi:polyisoprenoid-binding protein YceI
MYEEIPPAATNGRFAHGRWTVDASNSRVRFEVGNLWGLTKVTGEFERVGGLLSVGAEAVDARLTIDASSLTTGNTRRDKHLRSADFLGVEEHPEIRFDASAISWRPGGAMVTGDLLIGDFRHTLTLPVEVYGETDDLVLTTKVRISRKLVGLGRDRLGMVGADVLVNLELALTRTA